jgi:hypothetical protein
VHDVAGARRAGLRGILIARGSAAVPAGETVEVIRSLNELPALVGESHAVVSART